MGASQSSAHRKSGGRISQAEPNKSLKGYNTIRNHEKGAMQLHSLFTDPPFTTFTVAII
jgi:hypothetical protein